MTGIWFDVILGITLLLCLALVVVLQRPELTLDESAIDFDIDTLERNSAINQWLFPSRLMRQSGIMPQRLLLLYWPVKVVLAILGPMALLELHGLWDHWLVLLATSIAGFFAMDLWLFRRRAQRRIRILQALSFFVDLLSAYLKSGSTLSQAFEHAASYGFKKDHPLASESMLVCTELKAGKELREALQSMWHRTNVQDLYRLAAVLEVGSRVGAPVLETLQAQSKVMRVKQKELGTKLISRKSMEMFLPIGLVCVPMFFVLVLFPAGVQLYDALRMLKALL